MTLSMVAGAQTRGWTTSPAGGEPSVRIVPAALWRRAIEIIGDLTGAVWDVLCGPLPRDAHETLTFERRIQKAQTTLTPIDEQLVTEMNPAKKVFKRHHEITETALALMVDKNHDYAGASGMSPFANFEMAEKLGVCSAEEGIILRMGDKLRRLATFAKDGKLKVTSEGSLDAILDIINYGVLLQCMIEDRASGL